MTKNNTKKIPRLRFKGFEGEWEEKKLGDSYNVIMGQSPRSSNYTSNELDEVLVQGNADIKNGQIYPRIFTKEITKESRKGNIIFTVRAPVGEVAINQLNKVVIGRGVSSISGNYFLYSLLKQLKYYHYWDRLSSGSTFESINSHDITNSNIIIPSSIEQQKIGSFFTKLDQLIDLQRQKLEQLEKLKHAYLQKMFPQKGENIPRLIFNGFSGEWEEKKLKDISFSFSSSLNSKSILKNGKYPLYDANGIIGYINDFYSESRYLSIIKDGSNAGRIKLMPKCTSITGTMSYINSKSTDILFLYYLIHTLNIKKFKIGTGIPHIYFKDYSKLPLFIPFSDEQSKIGSFLYNIDENIKLSLNKIHYIKNLKKAYLQKMFC